MIIRITAIGTLVAFLTVLLTALLACFGWVGIPLFVGGLGGPPVTAWAIDLLIEG